MDGEHIPEGTVLGSCQYSVNRNAAYFPEPEAFRPERWLCDELNTLGDVGIARRAFSPFSAGPRSCVGWRLAWMEATLILARTFFSHDVRIAPEAPCCHGEAKGKDCEFELVGHVIAVVNGPLLQFKKRD